MYMYASLVPRPLPVFNMYMYVAQDERRASQNLSLCYIIMQIVDNLGGSNHYNGQMFPSATKVHRSSHIFGWKARGKMSIGGWT